MRNTVSFFFNVGIFAHLSNFIYVFIYNICISDPQPFPLDGAFCLETVLFPRFAPSIFRFSVFGSFFWGLDDLSKKESQRSKRCRLLPSNSDDRRGTIRYAGPVPEIPDIGTWVGIELDEPTGKNDGSVAGKRYFECKPSRGVFVRPERVEVGTFSSAGRSGRGHGGDVAKEGIHASGEKDQG